MEVRKKGTTLGYRVVIAMDELERVRNAKLTRRGQPGRDGRSWGYDRSRCPDGRHAGRDR